MADQDETPVEETNPDGSPKKDLRYSSHEERNVRVDRQLDGSGHLARGDVTRMSVLNFSSRHQSRTERDPEFTHRPAPVKKEPVAEPAVPPPVTAAAPETAAPVTPAPAESPGLVDRIKSFLGL